METAAMMVEAGRLAELQFGEEENPNYQRSFAFASSSSCGKESSENL